MTVVINRFAKMPFIASVFARSANDRPQARRHASRCAVNSDSYALTLVGLGVLGCVARGKRRSGL